MENAHVVEAQMLIRRPVGEVFQAFIDPEITTNFWFTKSSGKLETGKSVTWEWEMYGASANVLVNEIVSNKKISTQWGNPATNVDYEFTAFSADTTYIVIKNYGFDQTGDELIHVLKDSTSGFTTLVDSLKAYLEFGIKLNLVLDKFPKSH